MRILPFGMGRGRNHPSEHGWNMVHKRVEGNKRISIHLISIHLRWAAIKDWFLLMSHENWNVFILAPPRTHYFSLGRPSPTNHDEGHLFQHVFAVGEELPEPYCFPALLHIAWRIFEKEPPWCKLPTSASSKSPRICTRKTVPTNSTYQQSRSSFQRYIESLWFRFIASVFLRGTILVPEIEQVHEIDTCPERSSEWSAQLPTSQRSHELF